MPADAIAHIAALLAAIAVGAISLRAVRIHWPLITLAVCVVLSICLYLQIRIPALLPAVERDGVAIRAGEWWRIATALFFQDGWLAGGLFNLATLLLVGGIAEQILTRQWWLFVYAAAGLATELVALALQPIGAGNSIAVAGLGGATLVLAPMREGKSFSLSLRFLAAGAAAFLLYHRDIHGVAVAIGAAIAAGLLVRTARHGITIKASSDCA